MNDDGLGDWRIAFATTLTEDLPAAYPGGPSHRKGTGAYLTTSSQNKGKPSDILTFITPHPSALAFNIAFEYSRKAQELKSRLATIKVIAPEPNTQAIQMANIPFLYDYFEQAMIAISFSFQAIEAFSNNEMVHNSKGAIKVKRKNKWQSFSPIEAERTLSTEEKIASVLPELLKVSTPKGKLPWEGFKKLKIARDSTIHIKSKDIHNMTKPPPI